MRALRTGLFLSILSLAHGQPRQAAQAKTRASQLHVTINAIVDDLTHYEPGKGEWDLIAAFYRHAWYNGSRRSHIVRFIAEKAR